MQSTNLPRRWSRKTKQSAIYSEFCGILSDILWNFVVFYGTWRKDMGGSDWPKTSLQTAVQRNGDSLLVGVYLFE